MSSIIEDTGESDEELVRKNMQTVLTSQVINRTDPSEEWARMQRRKKQQQQYELEQKLQTERFKAQEARQFEIDKIKNEQDLQAAGLARYGRWPEPHEIFYDLDRHECVFGCKDEVRYIYKRSPNLTSKHSITMPYSLDKEEFHLCSSLSKEQRAIFENIIRMIFDLRIGLLNSQVQSTGLGRMTSESNLVSLR